MADSFRFRKENDVVYVYLVLFLLYASAKTSASDFYFYFRFVFVFVFVCCAVLLCCIDLDCHLATRCRSQESKSKMFAARRVPSTTVAGIIRRCLATRRTVAELSSRLAVATQPTLSDNYSYLAADLPTNVTRSRFLSSKLISCLFLLSVRFA